MSNFNDQYSDFGSSDQAAVYDAPERTSVLAVASLVCSLICCLPAVPTIGMMLGAGAIVGITKSNGRVGGRGLAIAGVVVGLIMTVMQLFAFFGIVQFGKLIRSGFGGPFESFAVAVEMRDFNTARAQLEPGLAQGLSDEELEAFRDTVVNTLGAYRSQPDSLLDWTMALSAQAQNMQRLQARGEGMPLTPTFDSGTVLAYMFFDSNLISPTGSVQGAITNIAIAMPDGTTLWLNDPNTSRRSGIDPAPAVESPTGQIDPLPPLPVP